MSRTTQPNIKETVRKSAEEKRKIRQESDIRTTLAIIVSVIYFLFVIFVVVLWGYDIFQPIDGRTEKVKDLILTIYGILSGPLGLVAGYYFAVEKNK